MSRLLRPSLWHEHDGVLDGKYTKVLDVPALGRRFKMIKDMSDFCYYCQKNSTEVIVKHGIMALYRSHDYMLDYCGKHKAI